MKIIQWVKNKASFIPELRAYSVRQPNN